jgi:hypothetical protein
MSFSACNAGLDQRDSFAQSRCQIVSHPRSRTPRPGPKASSRLLLCWQVSRSVRVVQQCSEVSGEFPFRLHHGPLVSHDSQNRSLGLPKAKQSLPEHAAAPPVTPWRWPIADYQQSSPAVQCESRVRRGSTKLAAPACVTRMEKVPVSCGCGPKGSTLARELGSAGRGAKCQLSWSPAILARPMIPQVCSGGEEDVAGDSRILGEHSQRRRGIVSLMVDSFGGGGEVYGSDCWDENQEM